MPIDRDGGRASKTVEFIVEGTNYFYTVLASDVNNFATFTSTATGMALVESLEIDADTPFYTPTVDKDLADTVVTYVLIDGDQAFLSFNKARLRAINKQ